MAGIRLRGLRAGNLRALDLDLRRGRWTALHGPSGAGKSALLFGVLEPVSRRRFRVLHEPAALPEGGEAWLSRIADSVTGLQPVVAWAGEMPRGRAQAEVGEALDLWPLLAAAWRHDGVRRCARCAATWRPAERAMLVGQVAAAAPQDPVYVYSAAAGARTGELLRAGWTRVEVDGVQARLEEAADPLPAGSWLLLDRLRWSPERADRLGEAFAEALRRGSALRWSAGDHGAEYSGAEACPQCAAAVAARPLEQLRQVREADDLVLAGRSWSEWAAAPLADWIELSAAAQEAARTSHQRIDFLIRCGLGHLAARRELGTLSLGESRRLELVALLSQVRRDQLVLFDEPGMGLHGRERRELATLLRQLVQQGNTVLTADPAREFIEAADEWVLLGPGGGPDGGRLVARGSFAELPEQEAWKPPRALPPDPEAALRFRALRTRFLDIDELSLPLGRLVAIAGVSGSGKSTLLEAELVPRLREERDFDGRAPAGGVAVLLERALGHAAMSTVATLSGAWTEIRELFADGEEARIRGLNRSDLVARPEQGGCAACRGHGTDPSGLPCAECEGLGLRDDLLELRMRGRTLRDWLLTPLAKLEKRLASEGKLRNRVRFLVALGLGARRFGERGRYLSLGERSRIALARALATARRGRPKLFLLDEPCLGLPSWEARKVVDLLRELRAEGHGFWIVDHHEVLLRCADWLIELGPGAGPEGGRLLFEGPPAQVRQRKTPTGAWLLGRSRKPKPPPEAPEPPPLRSEALPDSWQRSGRQALEQQLLRELATRSPLIADVIGGESSSELARSVPPSAWPVRAARDASLLQVLGLEERLAAALQRHGVAACARCGGAGPWRDLAAAVASTADDALGTGEWLFSTPLLLSERASGQAAELLRAAGFRRLLRDGSPLTLRGGAEPRAGDEVWLDRFDARSVDEVARLRDLEHHARLLGAGLLRARRADGTQWEYQEGGCRSCRSGGVAQPAAFELQLAGQGAEALREQSLRDCLEHLATHAAEVGPFTRALELLAGAATLRRNGGAAAAGLQPLEQQLLRLVGWLLFPVEGVVLLHDQPLSGLPPRLAARLRAALLAVEAGAHRFTDPEGGPAEPAAGSAAASLVQAFSLELDFAAWARPQPVAERTRLREALGLNVALQDHFLRTEEARLRGWARKDLARGPGGRVCPQCRGSGGPQPHPELQLPCPGCGGSGWGRETAALEDRGLRWPDLGATRIAALRRHFAATAALAGPLEVAEVFGMGELALDSRLAALPRGARTLAPLCALLAAGDLEELRLAAPTAGLSSLEASDLANKLEGYLSVVGGCEWRDHHPALLLPDSDSRPA